MWPVDINLMQKKIAILQKDKMCGIGRPGRRSETLQTRNYIPALNASHQNAAAQTFYQLPLQS